MSKRKINIGVISLGCDKNRVDTEHMLSYLEEAGFSFTSDPKMADVIIINTCGFIKASRQESYDTIVEMIEYRKKGRCKRLIVTGCMPQKDEWLKQMREDLPEVDIFLGINSYDKIVKIINDSLENKNFKYVRNDKLIEPNFFGNRVITTPSHYAYLKIADGCDKYCAFCTIPFIRGRYRSRSIESLVAEATNLVDGGATELILVAQDVTKYGEDLQDKTNLVKLIKELSKIKKLKWIRLLYLYPEQLSDSLLREIINNKKVCKYIDIPFQHASSKILKMMNRKSTGQMHEELITKIQNLPDYVAVRTTFMVGFPGETEEDYLEIEKFIQSHPMQNVGFFAYSREEGTASYNYPNQVDEKTKQKRLIKLIKLQKKIARDLNKQKFVGKTIEVVYEGIDYEKQRFFGRSQYQAPEIDTVVYFKSSEPIPLGAHVNVKITGTKDYDLQGVKDNG